MPDLINHIKGFIKRETVLVIAGCCALLSMLFVPPDGGYAGYVDLRVLALLLCLMLVVAGLQKCGLFVFLAGKLLSGEKGLRLISLMLVLLPFVCSMFITNDVALLTFVPFTILVLDIIGKPGLLIWIVVLQTVAANLGSMAMPVGNPQNLYLYGRYGIPAAGFFSVMLPLSAVSLLGVGAAALFVPDESLRVDFPGKIERPRKLILYTALFALCLLSVFHILPYGALLAAVLAAVLFSDRELLLSADYGLLLTFVCFFVFAGNMGRIAWVKETLSGLLSRNSALTGVLASQVISNVPAAVLLSGFTENWKGLLIGTNLGGLGTPIASLASLISIKFYLKTKGARPFQYLAVFTAVNAAGLVILYAAAVFLFHGRF